MTAVDPTYTDDVARALAALEALLTPPAETPAAAASPAPAGEELDAAGEPAVHGDDDVSTDFRYPYNLGAPRSPWRW